MQPFKVMINLVTANSVALETLLLLMTRYNAMVAGEPTETVIDLAYLVGPKTAGLIETV